MVDSDVFYFKLSNADNVHTNRSVLAYIASIYDPLGLIAPALLPGNCILRDVVSDKIGWDTPLPDSYGTRWNKWSEGLEDVEQIKIPRCIKPSHESIMTTEVRVFSDASEKGYGFAAYVRQVSTCGAVHCRLLMGKSRGAPIKFVTIPRLKLTAALLAAKLSQMLTNEVRLLCRRLILWSDSSIVLQYLFNTQARYTTFVVNRVRRIREWTDASQ